MSKDEELEELIETLSEGVSDGLFEIAEEVDAPGKTRYKLTDYGNVEAEQLIATTGLPFLVMIYSKKSVAEGKERTVRLMADKIIRKFPAKLKRQAKTTFAPFWGEFADVTAEEYLEQYEKAK